MPPGVANGFKMTPWPWLAHSIFSARDLVKIDFDTSLEALQY
jgi:hypothetical protein